PASAASCFHESAQPDCRLTWGNAFVASQPGLFAVAREKMRTRHLSLRTEQAYLQWLRRYIAFHGRKHPRKLGAPEVEQFLTFLAVRRKVSAATQNQALQALLFLYRHVLETELPWLANITRATRPKRLPVVLSRTDARSEERRVGKERRAGKSPLLPNEKR